MKTSFTSVNSHHKGQWHWPLMFSFICAWINGWVKNREAGDLRRYRTHYGVIVMVVYKLYSNISRVHCAMILPWFSARLPLYVEVGYQSSISLATSSITTYVSTNSCTFHYMLSWRSNLMKTLARYWTYVPKNIRPRWYAAFTQWTIYAWVI